MSQAATESGSSGTTANELVSFYFGEPVAKARNTAINQVPWEKVRDYDFDTTIPEANVVYVVVQRPHRRPYLVPFGSYREWALESQYNEVLHVMQSLGASEITCRQSDVEGRRWRVRGRIFGIGKAEAEAEKAGQRKYDCTIQGTGGQPRDPGPLTWPQLPGLSTARRAVLENGATKVSLTVASDSQFSLQGDLAAKIKAVGLSLGVEVQISQATVLHLEASFPQRPRMRM